jgi:hypothetical protein
METVVGLSYRLGKWQTVGFTGETRLFATYENGKQSDCLTAYGNGKTVSFTGETRLLASYGNGNSRLYKGGATVFQAVDIM